MEIERSSFASGWLFRMNGRLFHADGFPWTLVEYRENGRLPEIGRFDRLDGCEAAIREAVQSGTHYAGDVRPTLPAKLKLDTSFAGLYYFSCRRRAFRIQNDKAMTQGEEGRYTWKLQEELPTKETRQLGAYATLNEAKQHILDLCTQN